VRNLPFNISAEDLYAIFGKYGAVDHLSGFNVGGRYLVVLYYQPAKFQRRAEADEKEKELQLLRKKVEQHKKNATGT
jgi:pre-mRNA branch site protein p14